MLFELYGHEDNIKFVRKEFALEDVGPQKCMASSVDGSKLATGGVDGRFRLFEWPTMRIIVDEPKSHKSFRDMDFRGSKDGDICVIEVKKMEISSLNKRMHLGTNITSLEFYPSERVALTTSSQWGAMVTKLNVSADWKEWQIYLLLWGLFLASAILFYMFFENSDSFWNFPHPSSRLKIETLHGDPTSDEQWSSFDLRTRKVVCRGRRQGELFILGLGSSSDSYKCFLASSSHEIASTNALWKI
ncbi:SEC12-like protein 1 isoform X2 [Lycium barbarum]|uniref:SEC12-like protein 1 isoform X2 n=1 Tax=Lycium barbarum TaxID=112863 RepID=UPI00293E9733|nr:SEC12-like protein 1 isoform X2 [Lycium barbarum]